MLVSIRNHLEFGATMIAAIYTERWQKELFFKAQLSEFESAMHASLSADSSMGPEVSNCHRSSTHFQIGRYQ